MKKILLLILLLAVAAVGFLFFTEQGLAVRTMVERQAPIVTPATVPQAVGRSGHTFKFKVNDGRSGVAQVRAVGRAFKTPGEILHGDLELLVQSFEPPVIGEKEIEVVVPAGSELLRTDGAQIQVELTVTDRSLFANSASESATALIDLITPRVEVLTGQHNVAQGGIGLAFYKVNKRPPLLIRHGVVVAGIEHPGVPASVWDKSFESQPDLYAALFYLPYSEQMEALNRPELDAIPRAFAVDHANNRVQVDLPHYVIGKSQPAETLKLNRKFLENKIPPLAESYNQETGTVLPNEADVTDQLVSLFLLVNQGYRGWLGQKIKGMLVQPTPEILWQGLFQRPMAAKSAATSAATAAVALPNRFFGLVDLDATCTALDQGLLGGLAMDVFEEETRVADALRGLATPTPAVEQLRQLARRPNVIFTPHNAFNTLEAVERKSLSSVEQLVHFWQQGRFRWPWHG